MKSLRPLLLAFVAIVSAAAVQAGPVIGVLLKGKSDFWSAVGKGATAAGEKVGAQVIVKAPPAETDVAVQIALLNALANQGIQALVIAPTSPDALSGPVKALAAKGVKVIVIDSPLNGNVGASFVGTDQKAAGEAAGQLMAGLVTDKDQVAFLRHNQSGSATMLRETGAMDSLKAAHASIVVHGDIYSSTENGVETERSELLLSKYPTVKAIFASGTPGTMAMLKVLEAHKSSVKLIGCGFNLNPDVVTALTDGSMAGWVAQLPEDIGSKGVETAAAAIGGQTVPANVKTDFVVVTKDNLGDPKIKALLTL